MNYLDYFKELCSIPHGSGNTKMIGDYLVKFAEDRNLEHYRDEIGNVIIIKEASAGREGDEPVIIQGHMDMVAVKEDDCDIDMLTDGLRIKEEGDFLFAEGTSLGADDGVAVATALALIDSDLSLPRIEAVITVDEEVGMDGAAAIDLSMLKGHTMLNLDSEEEGYFLVSCAGGARVDFVYDLNNDAKIEPKEGNVIYEIEMSGFIGGHSGTEIDKPRANAIRIMCRLLRKLYEGGLVIALADIEGGTADNAICNGCRATVLAKTIEPELFELYKLEAMEAFLGTEKNVKMTYTQVNGDYCFYQPGDFLHFLNSLPNGVMAMSEDVPGLVETSLNHGIIKMNGSLINLSVSVRSNINEKKEELIKTLKELADIRLVKTTVRSSYPGWAFRKDSPLRDKMIKVYKEMYGEEPVVKALHAGLECGMISEKIEDLDCVSFGPNIYDIHTTKEKLSLSSMERTWKFIVELLK